MKRLRTLATTTVLAFASVAGAQQKSSTAEVVRAADTFLGTLTAEQRQKVVYAFDDTTQRARWSNFPTGVVARGGISLKHMTAPQQEAVMKLLGTVLSPMGLEKVNEIRQADDDFKANGSKRGPGGEKGRVGLHAMDRVDLRRGSAVVDRVGLVVRAALAAVLREETCSEAIFTSSRFLGRLPPHSPGCCSSAVITSR